MEKIQSHESQALLSFSRISSNKGEPLFGSSIFHENTIVLRITPAALYRSLHGDSYSPEGHPYIEVEMSQSQFAEAISTMNIGTGTPVTVRRLQGKKVDNPIFVNKAEQFEDELQEKVNAVYKEMKEASETALKLLNEKKSITKSDRETILKGIHAMHRAVVSNMPFLYQQFNEQMEKTVHEAKSEIEAFSLNVVQSLGLQKLEELKSLNGEMLTVPKLKLIDIELSNNNSKE